MKSFIFSIISMIIASTLLFSSVQAQSTIDPATATAIGRVADGVTRLAGEVQNLKARKPVTIVKKVSVAVPGSAAFSNAVVVQGLLVASGVADSLAAAAAATTNVSAGQAAYAAQMRYVGGQVAKVTELVDAVNALQGQITALQAQINGNAVVAASATAAVNSRLDGVETKLSAQARLIMSLPGYAKASRRVGQSPTSGRPTAMVGALGPAQ